MRKQALFLALLLSATISLAGWDDLAFSCPQNYQDFRQGRPINITLNATNFNKTDGYAAYITNITLHPPQCVNNGESITINGTILCTSAEPACNNRYRTAPTSIIFNFTGLPTDPECANGLNSYYFTVMGNTEFVDATSRWSADIRATNTSQFNIRFIGPDVCGDLHCGAPVETCANCEQDCGRCPECAEGERACRNNSIVECVNGFFTRVVQACGSGCVDTNGTPGCRRECELEGESRCAGNRTLQTCVGGTWLNETCPRACVDGACSADLCAGVVCPDKCELGTAYSHGACDPATGSCRYFTESACEHGCEGSVCRDTALPTETPQPTPGGAGSPCCGGIAIVLLLSLPLFLLTRG